MNVAEQIERGILICPRTRHKLTTTEDGNWLENNDKTQRYRLSNTGAPILLVDEKWAEEYAGGRGDDDRGILTQKATLALPHTSRRSYS